MSGTNNTSQDPEYEGLPYHEKKLHKTHFSVRKRWKGTHPKDDPNWEYIGVGRWRRIPKKRVNADDESEERNAT